MFLGAGTAPVFLCTLLVGVFVLRGLLQKSRVRSAVLLGTAATRPTLLLVTAGHPHTRVVTGVPGRPSAGWWSGDRGEGEQAAAVRLGMPDSAGHGAADGVGVGDLEDAVVRHRGERDRSHAPFEGLGLAAVQP